MKQVKDNSGAAKIVGLGVTVLVSGVLLLILTGESALGDSGGDYELSWYTIDRGGIN